MIDGEEVRDEDGMVKGRRVKGVRRKEEYMRVDGKRKDVRGRKKKNNCRVKKIKGRREVRGEKEEGDKGVRKNKGR